MADATANRNSKTYLTLQSISCADTVHLKVRLDYLNCSANMSTHRLVESLHTQTHISFCHVQRTHLVTEGTKFSTEPPVDQKTILLFACTGVGRMRKRGKRRCREPKNTHTKKEHTTQSVLSDLKLSPED